MHPALKNIIFIAIVFLVASLIGKIFSPGGPDPTGELTMGPTTLLRWMLGILILSGMGLWLYTYISKRRSSRW